MYSLLCLLSSPPYRPLKFNTRRRSDLFLLPGISISATSIRAKKPEPRAPSCELGVFARKPLLYVARVKNSELPLKNWNHDEYSSVCQLEFIKVLREIILYNFVFISSKSIVYFNKNPSKTSRSMPISLRTTQ
jgi:hypothetical protein